MTQEEENVSLVNKTYEAFSHNDLRDVTEMFTEKSMIHGPTLDQLILPWGGVFQGREGASRFFTTLANFMEIKIFQPREYLAQGDKVVVIGYIEGRMRTTGRPYRTSSYRYSILSLGGSSGSARTMIQPSSR